MYPVRLGFKVAQGRCKRLVKNGHYAEALVTTVFTFEKTLRRTLRQLVVSAGLTSKNADTILENINNEKVKKYWEIFDPNNKKVTEIIGNNNWALYENASKKRNDLVHGNRVYDLEECKKDSKELLKSLVNVVELLDETYGFNGWEKLAARKKNRLHIDPRVKIKKD